MTRNRLSTYVCLALMALLLGACGGSDSTTSTTPTTPTSPTNDGSGTTTSSQNPDRLCSAPLSGVTGARLSNFFGIISDAPEGAPTFCLKLTDGASSLASSALRIEFENNQGLYAYNANSTNYFSGSSTAAGSATSIKIVYADGSGLVQVKGTLSADTFVGEIDFAAYPSAQSQSDDAKIKCRTGAYSIAQCFGYNFPSTGYYVSPAQLLRDQANAVLNDPTQLKQLGTFSVSTSALGGNI